MKLKDRVAIVTGAAGGIGRATSLFLAGEGCNVVLADINVKGAEQVAAEIVAGGGRAIPVRADVTSAESVGLMVKTSLDKLGRIDILVNVAGGNRRVAFREMTETEWDSTITLNLKGVFLCTRAVINHMIERGRGRVINIASTAGVRGTPMTSHYSAAKAGIIGLTKALAKEVAGFGVNVNSISPGSIDTPLLRSAYVGRPAELEKQIAGGIVGNPEDIANMVLFLASDEAKFIIGQNYIADGGKVIGR